MTFYKNNLNVSETCVETIANYRLVEAIKTGEFKRDTFYNKILSSEEFTNLISGKNLKKLLFEDQKIEKKRLQIEEYGKVIKIKLVIQFDGWEQIR